MQPRSYRTLLAVLASIVTMSHGASAAVTSEGCYVADTLTSLGTYQYQSEGYCAGQCTDQGYAVFGMSDGNVCACGNSLPTTKASSSMCDTACVGYPSDTCGGTGYYSVWLTGVGTLSGSSNSAAASAGTASSTSIASSTSTKKTTAAAAADTGSSTTSTPAAAPSIVYVTTAIVQQGVTVIQTVSAETASSTATSSGASSSSSAKSSTASKKSSSGLSGGAIAGIVVGVLAALGIGAALLYFTYFRRHGRDDDDFGGEYKRHIEAGGAGHTQSPSPSLVDNRLDTSLAIRRNSSESLADNQDYSRKILRVVN